MFNAVLTAATTAAPVANVAAVANFINNAVAHLGLGVTNVASAGAATQDEDSNVTAWVATAKVNGFNAQIMFSAGEIPAPAGAVVTDYTHDRTASKNFIRWNVAVQIDGNDADTTADLDETVLAYSALVGLAD